MKRALIAAAAFALSALVPLVAHAKPCAVLIGVTATGVLYEDGGGAWVRRSPKVLEGGMSGECYPEGGPSPISSVTLAIAPNATKAKVDSVYALLARTGWPQAKVVTIVWINAPRRPVQPPATPAPH